MSRLTRKQLNLLTETITDRIANLTLIITESKMRYRKCELCSRYTLCDHCIATKECNGVRNICSEYIGEGAWVRKRAYLRKIYVTVKRWRVIDE